MFSLDFNEEEEYARFFRIAEHMPASFEERLAWVDKKVWEKFKFIHEMRREAEQREERRRELEERHREAMRAYEPAVELARPRSPSSSSKPLPPPPEPEESQEPSTHLQEGEFYEEVSINGENSHAIEEPQAHPCDLQDLDIPDPEVDEIPDCQGYPDLLPVWQEPPTEALSDLEDLCGAPPVLEHPAEVSEESPFLPPYGIPKGRNECLKGAPSPSDTSEKAECHNLIFEGGENTGDPTPDKEEIPDFLISQDPSPVCPSPPQKTNLEYPEMENLTGFPSVLEPYIGAYYEAPFDPPVEGFSQVAEQPVLDLDRSLKLQIQKVSFSNVEKTILAADTRIVKKVQAFRYRTKSHPLCLTWHTANMLDPCLKGWGQCSPILKCTAEQTEAHRHQLAKLLSRIALSANPPPSIASFALAYAPLELF